MKGWHVVGRALVYIDQDGGPWTVTDPYDDFVWVLVNAPGDPWGDLLTALLPEANR